MMGDLEKVLMEYINKGTPDRRCMVCKHWMPIDEFRGKCKLGNPPFFKHPNYVCHRFVHYKE